MLRDLQTVYANVFALRTTANEIVLEFGAFFPESEEEAKAGAPSAERNLRVIMSRAALEPLTGALNEILRQITSAQEH